MPQDCNLVSYSASNAVFYSATYGQGIPLCTLTVSSSGGGFITVADSKHTVLYLQPKSFGVLVNVFTGVTNGTSLISEEVDLNKVYNASTGAVVQTANTFNQTVTADRTLLPTINAVLPIGRDFTSPNTTVATTALYSPATGTWAPTGSPPADRVDFGLVTLPNGNALLLGGAVPFVENGALALPVDAQALADCQLYMPASGKWAATAPLATPRQGPGVAVMRNGNVLVAGGFFVAGLGNNSAYYPTTLASAEIYNPLTGTWSGETLCYSRLSLKSRRPPKIKCICTDCLP